MATAKRDLTDPLVQGQGDTLLVAEEAAALLRISVSQLYHLTSSRRIPFLKVGQALRFDRSRLLEELAQEPVAPAAERTGSGVRAAGRTPQRSKKDRRIGRERYEFPTPRRSQGKK